MSPLADISLRPLAAGRLARMCKRLVIPEQEDAEKEVSVDQRWWRFSVRFNVAVTHRVPVARLHEWDTEGVMMRWGFVPSADERQEGRVGAAFVRSDAILELARLSKSVAVWTALCGSPGGLLHVASQCHGCPAAVLRATRESRACLVWRRFGSER